MTTLVRVGLSADGRVQGTGLRPFVAGRAAALGLTGWVRNEAAGLSIEAQGGPAQVEAFIEALRSAPPPVSLRALARRPLTPRPPERGFSIAASTEASASRGAVLAPDLALCGACAAELDEPRRAGYALISCAACGPRWTAAAALPWDRERTVFDRFPPCERCAAEYADAGNRRHHGQTISCADCGPRLSADLAAACETLRSGGVLALLGVGGWQLLCDALSEPAVARLRTLKRRPDKPLAVLVERAPEGLAEAELALLRSPAAPIVLVEASLALADGVRKGRRRTGLMLPTTGAHLLLARRFGGPLVCTSGNVAGEPLGHRAEAPPEADRVLAHDRPILRPVDDSVAHVVAGAPLLLRRARGFVPVPLDLGRPGPTVLALGAHLSAAPCLAFGDTAILGAHVGDLGRRGALERMEHAARELQSFFSVRPELIACDLHPDYGSSRLAERLASELGAPLRRVQHHRAHVAAVLAEHGGRSAALGLAWDGVGLGDDGGIWGSEAFEWDGARMRRVAHLRPFRLPGGDAAAREPARVLLGLGLAEEAGLPELVGQAMERGFQSPWCSSMGRLFDAVGVLLGGPRRPSYEAQTAVFVEELAGGEAAPGWRLPLEGGELDWRPLLARLLEERAAGVPPSPSPSPSPGFSE